MGCDRIIQINDALGDLVEAVGKRAAVQSQNGHVYGDAHYAYIPFDHSMVADALLGIKEWLKVDGFFNGDPRAMTPRFLDVGCGIADKVALAENLGFDASGIEYDEFLLSCAKVLFDPRLIANCALQCNYEGYHVIYFYQPFQDEELQKKLERRIYRQADLGAFIVTPQYVNPPSQRMYVTCTGYGDEMMATEDSISVWRRVRKSKERIVFRP
jgi:SAM-dependent methyltransferase